MSKPKNRKLNHRQRHFIRWHNRNSMPAQGLIGCVGFPIQKPDDCDCVLRYLYAERHGFDPVGNETQQEISAYLNRLRLSFQTA